MPDDPREILKAAGVDCAEVDEYTTERFESPEPTFTMIRQSVADAAILALARLVAKYKWQRDHVPAINGELFDRDQWSLDELDRHWGEHNA